MINKENILFGIVGLLFGLIVGFMFANSVNQGGMIAATPSGVPNANLPTGHPDLGGPGGGMQAEVQSAIDTARNEPGNFEAQMKAAEMFYQIQRMDGAIEFLVNANKLQPENYEVIVNLGNANFDASKYEEAEKWYTSALAKKQDDVNVRTDLGLTFVFRSQPDYDRAIREFKRSLEIDPKHVQALQNLTVAYVKKNDSANANATLAKLESIDGSNAAIAKLREDVSKLGAK